MELGGQSSPSSPSSASSLDSCSDLLMLLPCLDDFAFARLPPVSKELDHEILTQTSPRDSLILTNVHIQSNANTVTSDSHSDGNPNEETDIGDERDGDGAAFSTSFFDSHRSEIGTGTIEHEINKKNSRMPEIRPGVDFTLPSERSASSAATEADSDLQRLEDSVKLFDLHHKNTSLPQAHTFISGLHNGSDIYEFKEAETGTFACTAQTHRRSLSYDKMKGFASLAKQKQASTDLLSWLDYEDSRKDTLTSLVERAEYLIEAHKDRMLTMHFDDCSETTGSSDASPDRKARTLIQELINGETNKHSQLFGNISSETQITGNLPDPQVKEKPTELEILDLEDLGPDEIGRYLEHLDVNETYLDAKTIQKMNSDIDESKSNASLESNSMTDNSKQFSSFGLCPPRANCFLPDTEIPFIVNSVQVVGASQQKGGSSMLQRMVGVKDHTVYCIKVISEKHEWEVHRRYRDFMNFYQQLRQIFTSSGAISSISFSMDIDNDSHRVLGNISPTVVEARVNLIEKFLLSLIQAGPPYSTATPLFWFLRSPQGDFENTAFEDHLLVRGSSLRRSVAVQLGTLNISPLQSPSTLRNVKKGQRENGVPFAASKTIKLVLNIPQNSSLRELLRIQHYSCAGCYRHLDYEKGLIHGFAKAFGQSKPRFCEYTGQVFCSSCHLNELAVVPAYVLWHWDFTQKRVCQFAKAYLDSIYDQPLLCVSTANPYLYQRVPCLANVQETRAKLSMVLSCTRCPFHSRILNIMGSRRYLMEKNDFFALRDLEDIAKGAFAVLPGLLNSVLKTLMQHVTKQCSVCQDSGEWCGAGILCKDPFQPIFPFNEEINILNCKVCNAPFHEACLTKSPSCPSCPKTWGGMRPLKASSAS